MAAAVSANVERAWCARADILNALVNWLVDKRKDSTPVDKSGL
jgi:hypothetical protein